MKTKINAAKNSIISFVLGDMMGTPVQFILRKNLQEALKKEPISSLILKSRSSLPFGAWSDDSSMTLCTMKSIIEKQEIDIENMSDYFLKWLYNSYLTPTDKTFDIGRTVFAALNNFKSNPKNQSGLTDINSNGNGSLMRILPVSIYCYFKKLSQEQTFNTIKNVSCITHAHPISILGCYIYTLIVFDILDGKSKDEIIENLKNIYNSESIPDEYREWLDEYKNIINGDIIRESAKSIDSSGYVKSTLGVVLWGFYNTDSVENCIFKIIELGHDSDTNGAVGAGLSGLYYSLRGYPIPQNWIDKIIKKEIIFSLIDEFADVLE